MNRTLIIIIGATLLVLSSGCSAADSTAHAASTTSTCAYVANDGSSLAKVTVTTASACGQVDPDSLGAMATYPDDTFEPAASDAQDYANVASESEVACTVQVGTATVRVFTSPQALADLTGLNSDICAAMHGVANPNG
jgi:hypothetical protein